MDYRPIPRKPSDFQQPPSTAEISTFATGLLGPSVRLASAHEIGGGAFNNTFLLTAEDARRWVLRVSPPRDHPHLFYVEHGLLRREHALAPWLPAISPLLPRIVGTDFTHEVCPRDAVLSDHIEGENWHAVQKTLAPADNDALWRELASHLRRIHATPAPHFGWTHPAPPHARWSDFTFDALRGLLADFPRLGVSDAEPRAWFDVASQGAAFLDEIATPHVLHGDPWPRNVLIRRDAPDSPPRIVALLDHERGLFGDPLSEWVFNGYNFPPAFWEAYGARPTDPASRFRALIYAGQINIQCLLESKRYGWDSTWQRNRLASDIDELRRLLA